MTFATVHSVWQLIYWRFSFFFLLLCFPFSPLSLFLSIFLLWFCAFYLFFPFDLCCCWLLFCFDFSLSLFKKLDCKLTLLFKVVTREMPGPRKNMSFQRFQFLIGLKRLCCSGHWMAPQRKNGQKKNWRSSENHLILKCISFSFRHQRWTSIIARLLSVVWFDHAKRTVRFYIIVCQRLASKKWYDESNLDFFCFFFYSLKAAFIINRQMMRFSPKTKRNQKKKHKKRNR